MTRSKKVRTPGRFSRGDEVRARPGVTDPDFPDNPLEGWIGRITEIREGDPPMYLVQWSEPTLRRMPRSLRDRCDREGFDFDKMWLCETDIELVAGK